MSRYEQLYSLIDQIKPRRIIEVGVARTVRAREMSLRALSHGGQVHYMGYDVFDSVDDDFHIQAYNHKRVEPLHWCERKMGHIVKAHPDLFTFELVRGDTRETLRGKTIRADFAFIDGDHRAEVIASDYWALRKCKIVALDDWYEADERGIPDVAKLGCNRLIDDLKARGFKVEILPIADSGKYQGKSRIAVVRR